MNEYGKCRACGETHELQERIVFGVYCGLELPGHYGNSGFGCSGMHTDEYDALTPEELAEHLASTALLEEVAT